ncbi:hypothetical protein LINGRAHAP2_LOCUS5795 [Linum grandiflorum]
MSFQDHGLWRRKGAPDEDQTFNNSSRMEPKRSHQWFGDGAELDLYPHKKQAVGPSIGMTSSGVPTACQWDPNTKVSSRVPTGSPWDPNTHYQRESDQYIHKLFGSDAPGSDSLIYRNIPHGGTGNVVDASSAGLSSSHGMGHADLCIGYGGARKVKVDQVKGGSGNEMSHYSRGHNSFAGTDFSISGNQEANTNKEEENVLYMNQIYNGGGAVNTPNYVQGGMNAVPTSENGMPFDGFHVGDDPLQPYDVSLVGPPEATHKPEPDASNSAAAPKPKQSKTKPDSKPSRKNAPNSFPANVKSLLQTGMLDGIPVKYVSVSREAFQAVIKDSGFLCGCQSCNYAKAVNAYELERHAGFKSKHPNSHIYFDNGKTIYQVVQELKSTPQSQLFDVIQTVFGAPLNEKAFKSWKESYEAASRALQRIYGKDELNL